MAARLVTRESTTMRTQAEFGFRASNKLLSLSNSSSGVPLSNFCRRLVRSACEFGAGARVLQRGGGFAEQTRACRAFTVAGSQEASGGGRVLMVQGASRGLGLEFVRPLVDERNRTSDVVLGFRAEIVHRGWIREQIAAHERVCLIEEVVGSEFGHRWSGVGGPALLPQLKNIFPPRDASYIVRQLLSRSAASNVVATCRNPDSAVRLHALGDQYPGRLSILPLDVTDESSIEAAAKTVGDLGGGLDLLVNTAGILHIPSVLQPETGLGRVDLDSLLLTYKINAAGPLLVMKHFANSLKASRGKDTSKPPAVVANLSARVGSIGDNQIGGWYSYRASKSALNQLTKTASVEFARQRASVVCILLHPGTVDTDLSKPFQRNVPKGKLFTKEYSVEKLLGIIDNINLTDNGKFFAWDGEEIPW